MTFTTELRLEGKSATGIVVPAGYVEELGGGKRPAVVVTLNGRYSYRSTIMPYAGQPMLPVAAEHRVAAGLEAGQTVEVSLVLDTEPRTIEVPQDLESALRGQAGVWEAFDKLSFSHKREHVEAVLQAKSEETRARRVAKAVEMVARKLNAPR